MSKVILNPDTTATNMVKDADIRTVTEMTLKESVKQLLGVSGPYSRNSFILKNTELIASELSSAGSNVFGKHATQQEFTRDGIRTLQKTEYASIIQRYVRDELLTWMGKRIDASCHDGTTSSMIFTASFLMSMLRSGKEKLTFYSTTEVETAFVDITTEVEKRLEDYKVTAKNLHEYLTGHLEKLSEKLHMDIKIPEHKVREELAYMQAYTSSSGMEDVSQAVADVVANTPHTNDDINITIRTPHVETDKATIVSKSENYQFSTPGMLIDTTKLNYNNYTEYRLENAFVVILQSYLIGNSMTNLGIINYLRANAGGENKNLVILLPSDAEAYTPAVEDVVAIGKECGIEVIVAVYQRPIGYKAGGTAQYYVDALSYKADKMVLNDRTIVEACAREQNNADGIYVDIKDFIITAGIVHIDNHYIYVDDVIDFTRLENEDDKKKCQDLNIHPGELYPELYPNYTYGKSLLKKQLENNLAMPQLDTAVVDADINRALAMMAVLKNWYVELNGKLHDQRLYQSIIDDSAGAAVIALSDGVFFNGPVKLWKVLSDILSDKMFNQSVPHLVLMLTLLDATKDMIFSMFGKHAINISNSLDDIVNLSSGTYEFFNVYDDIDIVEQFGVQPFSYLTPGVTKNLKLVGDINNLVSRKRPRIVDYFLKKYCFNELVKEDIDVQKYGISEGNESKLSVPPCQVGNMFSVLFNRLREVSLRFLLTDVIIAPDAVWDDGKLQKGD